MGMGMRKWTIQDDYILAGERYNKKEPQGRSQDPAKQGREG